MFLWGFQTEGKNIYMRNENRKLRIVKIMKIWWREKGGEASAFLYIYS